MSTSTERRAQGTASRRARTVPALFAAALVLPLLAPLWAPITALADVVRGRTRLPTTRLLAFAVWWAWLETLGVLAAAGLWLVGKRGDLDAHYRLQRWWSRHLLGGLATTCGLSVDVRGTDTLTRGPVLLFVRHASLADSLVSAHVATNLGGLQPRFVLKRELLADPCLDIVGQRIPNHFLDREAPDSTAELAAVAALVADLGERDVAIIFPEGTRASPTKRVAALQRLGERDAARAERLVGLRHLLPPRPSGARTMAQAAPDADVVVAWHVGFEGLDRFSGILAALAAGPLHIEFVATRHPAATVPRDATFDDWLDSQWLEIDAEVDAALQARPTVRRGRTTTGG